MEKGVDDSEDHSKEGQISPEKSEVDEAIQNTNISSSSFSTGRWTNEEHIKFLQGCLKYGNNWKRVEGFVKTRNSSQIRSHAQKYLIKLNKKYKLLNNSFLFTHSHKNIKNLTNKINKKIIEQALINLSSKDIDMDSIEKLIMSLFFNNSEINADDIQFSSNNNNIEKKETQNIELNLSNSEEKSKIFECKKVPKNMSIDEYIRNCLSSYKIEDFNRLLSWLKSENVEIIQKIKEIISTNCPNYNEMFNIKDINNQY